MPPGPTAAAARSGDEQSGHNAPYEGGLPRREPGRDTAGSTLSARLRRFEHRIGAERSGRSTWVWLSPVLTGLVTAVLVAVFASLGELGPELYIPLALFCGVSIAAMTAAQLTAFTADPDQRIDPSDDAPR